MVSLDISGRLPHGVTKPFIEKIVSASYDAAGGRGDVQIVLSVVDDSVMRDLNKQHRGLDKTTDVLSFSYLEEADDFVEVEENSSGPLLGEIVISAEQIRRQARQADHKIQAEFALMLVHGTLHLLDYDHGTPEDETKMFNLQQNILSAQDISL